MKALPGISRNRLTAHTGRRYAFRDQLRRLRNARMLTQKQLSQRAGLALCQIAMYENGHREPHLPILVKIADVLEVSLDQLAGRMRRWRDE